MRQVENGCLLAELLREDGGLCFNLGLCSDLRPLEEVLQRVELLEPSWLSKRRWTHLQKEALKAFEGSERGS